MAPPTTLKNNTAFDRPRKVWDHAANGNGQNAYVIIHQDVTEEPLGFRSSTRLKVIPPTPNIS